MHLVERSPAAPQQPASQGAEQAGQSESHTLLSDRSFTIKAQVYLKVLHTGGPPVALGSLELDSDETDVNAVSFWRLHAQVLQMQFYQSVHLHLLAAATGQHISAAWGPRSDGRVHGGRRRQRHRWGQTSHCSTFRLEALDGCVLTWPIHLFAGEDGEQRRGQDANFIAQQV